MNCGQCNTSMANIGGPSFTSLYVCYSCHTKVVKEVSPSDDNIKTANDWWLASLLRKQSKKR